MIYRETTMTLDDALTWVKRSMTEQARFDREHREWMAKADNNLREKILRGEELDSLEANYMVERRLTW